MSRPRILLGLVAIVLIALGSATAPMADEARYKVIVHPDNPIAKIDREFLRDAYLKKATEWRGGETIRPVDLATKFPVRERFTHEVIRKTPAQLKNYWNQQIFSGKAVPPPEAGTAADLIAYVLANPGAIGYLPEGLDAGEAKVIGVE